MHPDSFMLSKKKILNEENFPNAKRRKLNEKVTWYEENRYGMRWELGGGGTRT